VHFAHLQYNDKCNCEKNHPEIFRPQLTPPNLVVTPLQKARNEVIPKGNEAIREALEKVNENVRNLSSS